MSKPKPHAQEPVDPVDQRLDEPLEETFPASDPIAVDPKEKPAAPVVDKDKKRH